MPTKKIVPKKAPAKKKSPVAKKAPAKKRAPKKEIPKIVKAISEMDVELTTDQRRAALQLSPEKLIFCNAILMGIRQEPAYYQAVPTTDAKPESVRVTASRWMDDPAVVDYLNAMKEAAVLATSHDRAWKRRVLIEVTNRSMELEPIVISGVPIEGKVQFDSSGAVRAINELNKMDGDHAATQVEVREESQSDRIRRLAALEDR